MLMLFVRQTHYFRLCNPGKIMKVKPWCYRLSNKTIVECTVFEETATFPYTPKPDTLEMFVIISNRLFNFFTTKIFYIIMKKL